MLLSSVCLLLKSFVLLVGVELRLLKKQLLLLLLEIVTNTDSPRLLYHKIYCLNIYKKLLRVNHGCLCSLSAPEKFILLLLTARPHNVRS